jgi:hypothetical protein
MKLRAPQLNRAALDVLRHSSHNGRYRPYPGTGSAILLAPMPAILSPIGGVLVHNNAPNFEEFEE